MGKRVSPRNTQYRQGKWTGFLLINRRKGNRNEWKGKGKISKRGAKEDLALSFRRKEKEHQEKRSVKVKKNTPRRDLHEKYWKGKKRENGCNRPSTKG